MFFCLEEDTFNISLESELQKESSRVGKTNTLASNSCHFLAQILIPLQTVWLVLLQEFIPEKNSI